MKRRPRVFCPHCSNRIRKNDENGIIRDWCPHCNVYFYENPLPVVSAIVVQERRILLVKRGKAPYKDLWCLPTGFAETGESIEDAALRELKEETGMEGNIQGLVDVDSCTNYFYGDLIFVTFEIECTTGKLRPGDDTVAAKYFPLQNIPKLAFRSNSKAVVTYIRGMSDYWAIQDSFSLSLKESLPPEAKKNLLSDRLVDMIEKNAQDIAEKCVEEVRINWSTAGYHDFDRIRLFKRFFIILAQFGKWMGGFYSDNDIRVFYTKVGVERRKEGLPLADVLSTLSLIKKQVFNFTISRGVWEKTINIYMSLEMDRRIMLFFDRVTYYITRGYEAGPSLSVGKRQ
ncbi:MAG: NUDIX hydrolase [Deltaproteobacteria bacterium]|jgi:ADP-ribose pyrophosphatase YjhB (NUDIX family)|nr:NUDIX hydrolase [Deltaproteobacteria bacterium]